MSSTSVCSNLYYLITKMRNLTYLNYYRKIVKNVNLRKYCNKAELKDDSKIQNIRNIGILAHIDAGKTTTTERMLFYSGTIRSMGEVHHGNTVTDYMEQERQRGITITSAAVSFPWGGSQINLIDTPGHIDFTMEVEQSLAVLDGAVVVLDSSAGVEAQTLTVWRQADNYRVPRLLYLNKMDRKDADEAACIKSIEDKLHVTPLLLHLPVRYDGKLIGIVDLVNVEEVIWTQGRGHNIARRKLTEKEDGKRWEATMDSHRQLIDTLSSLDDELAETVIKKESLENISEKEIHAAIRKCTIAQTAFPILCGSSYKNIGVQTLLDAVTLYLPSPLECNKLYKTFGQDLFARAFKVLHDDQRGVLTFLRLYSGEIEKGQRIYNLRQDKSEQSGQLYIALADDYKPVERVGAGNIAVVSALKATMSGELITSNQSSAKSAKSRLSALLQDPRQVDGVVLPGMRQRLHSMDSEPNTDELADVLLGIGTSVPEPVFLCCIEPPSLSQQQPLETALAELQREDPSLRVSTDEESGQIVLAGMGELHLEIIKERIIREYRIEVELGPLQIAYREALVGEGRATYTLDRRVGSARQLATVTASAKTVKGLPEDKVLRLDKSAESAANLAQIRPRQLAAIKHGVRAALAHGPRLSAPLTDVQVTLHLLEMGRGTSDSMLTAAVVQCLRKVFSECGTMLLEPVMSMEVVCPESHSARVLADLTRRRTTVHQITLRHGDKVIDCVTPLSELVGYSTTLRSLSSGLASFTMEFHSHQQMTPHDEEKAIKQVTGY